MNSITEPMTNSTTPSPANQSFCEIQKLAPQNVGELFELLSVFDKVFEPGKVSYTKHGHVGKLVNDPHFIAMVAKQNGKVIAGLTAHVLNNYGLLKPSVYLYDLAVLPAHQRQGIGKRLVATLMEYCITKGYKEIFVQAEADDVDAINFYRSTPISGEMNATQFYYTLAKN